MLFRKSSFSPNDLASVIRACRQQDARAQRVLFKQFFGYGKSICLRYTSSTEEAEDVLSEGFLKVFQHLDRYDDTQPFKAWLRTILVNTAISHYRRNQKYEALTTELEPTHHVAVTENVVDQMAADDILKLVQQLSDTHRTVFMMHVMDGYSLREIADQLTLNEATVRSHFSRARHRLQLLIQQHLTHIYPTRHPTGTLTQYEN